MNQQPMEGTTVYDAAGEKVGTVGTADPGAGYLDVRKGWLFPKDIYVPLDAVQRSDADGVYLSLHKNDLETASQYDQPPTAGTWSGTTTTGNAPASAETVQTSGTERFDQTTAQDVRVPLREEELVVGKRQEEEGRVHLHKDVIEEQQSVPVELQQERVTVERVPVQGQANMDSAEAFTEKDIDVPVMGEEAVVEKRAAVVEEVRLRKDTVTEQQQVSDTVRKERVTVDGADEVRGQDQFDQQR